MRGVVLTEQNLRYSLIFLTIKKVESSDNSGFSELNDAASKNCAANLCFS